MAKPFKYRVLISGILSPLAALFLYTLVYATLTWRSSDLEKDWLFRLSVSTLAMVVPFLITVVLAQKDRRNNTLSISGKVGLVFAIVSLGLVWKPVSDCVTRSKQVRNLALQGVAAPSFDTVDLLGKPQRLEDQKGKVVVVNIWAMSGEAVDVQKKFVEQVPVSYPLLTIRGNIPSFYRDIARYPAIFLIDRQGHLQPAPGPDQPFEKVAAAVDALLATGS
jgi:hypothetical protein